MKKIFYISLFVLLLSLPGIAQNTPVTKANYQLANRFATDKVRKMVFSTSVDPHWLKNNTRFWYVYETPQGKTWYLVDPAKGSKKAIFDNDKLAEQLTLIIKDPFDAQHLPLERVKFADDENIVTFQVRSTVDKVEKKDSTENKATDAKTDSLNTKKDSVDVKKAKPKTVEKPKTPEKKTFYFEYNLSTGKLTEREDYEPPKSRPSWASISPDGNTIVFAKNYNLYYMDKANYEKALKDDKDTTIVQTALTTDGTEFFNYGGGTEYENNVDKEKKKDDRKGAYVLWSPDSKRFVMTRSDNRNVKEFWVINSISEPRPTLESYKYQMPGEKESPEYHLCLFDMTTKTHKTIKTAAFKDQSIGISPAPRLKKDRDNDYTPMVWLGTNEHFYLTRISRDLKRIDICEANVNADTVRTVIEERMNTYIETNRLVTVNNGKEFIHWSERTGWGHFYLYDDKGNVKNAITSGPYHCDGIAGVDEARRVLYFTANGREKGEDPYYLHLYRVNFDGTGLKLLNPGDFDHGVSIDDDNRYFVNNYSRVNTVPATALYSTTGQKIMDLETADLSNLFDTGYKFPEIFKVKAGDGITDLYGVMYKPFDFDSTKLYPIIEYVYPGPQTEAVNKSFARPNNRIDRLAQLGFVVITVGNRGGHPSRSKWYHNYGYNNLRDYGLEDKKVAIEQLADRYPYIDRERVGIHGHSGGGFMSTAAILGYPNFFKVAVSCAGNHENNIYNRWWSEKHHGVKEIVSPAGDTTFTYSIDKNTQLAKNLKGRLLLVTGDMDNNVHPANTIRMANALIKANKRFDFLMLPGQRHGFGDMDEYFFWRMSDYFSRYLLEDYKNDVDIDELNK